MKFLGKISHPNYYIYWILIFWVILNFFSAYYTGLAHDEAYYWMFSKHLDWGYLDHPPMVAVLIWLGQLFFEGNLGARFFNVLINAGALLLLWRICKEYGSDLKLFFFLYFGIIAFHVYSFIIVPDSPLLAASILYFWILKKYLEKESLYNSLLLAVAITLMLYSKYHGFLILFFTILAVPKLLFRKSFWIIAFASILLFLPHILWQINNGFPTYQYHYLGRGNLAYNIKFTTNYILGLLLVSGPLLGFILWVVLFKNRAHNNWERILKVNIIGFVIFFFLASFRSKIEPNWNSPILIPLLIISYKYLIHQQKLRKWTLILSGISLILAFSFRVYAASEVIYTKLSPYISVKNEFHFWDTWAKDIEGIAKNRPVVFLNSYQLASKYAYYTGKQSFSYNSVFYRKNQYDLMDIEEDLQGKNVVLISKIKRDYFTPLQTPINTFYFAEVANFKSYNKVKIDLLNDNLNFEVNKIYPLKIKLTNQFSFPVNLGEESETEASIVISIFQHKKFISSQEFELQFVKKTLKPQENILQEVNFKASEEPGEYHIFISLKNGLLDPGLNYSNKHLKIN